MVYPRSRHALAKSRFEYVKSFEQPDSLLPNVWLVVRVDGRSFHAFTANHAFEKPNDVRALKLMNKCAEQCMLAFPDIVMAYGQSDEFSFVLRKDTSMFSRRESKISTGIVSCFAANYVFHWASFLPTTPLQYAPQFDSRVVCYPSLRNLRDYFSWRQADCHINNLYNTTFWALVAKGGLSPNDAKKALDGTLASDKNEILHERFGINYNDEPALLRKGSTLLRQTVMHTVIKPCPVSKDDPTMVEREVTRPRSEPVVVHVDMINPEFWTEHAAIFPADDASA